jgi:hypothetical protein
MGSEAERSGVHLTGEDSGFPVADPDAEPGPVKDGTGADPHPDATAVVDGEVATDGEAVRGDTGGSGGSYESRTDKELRKLAAKRKIKGRSKMDKDELIAALRDSD